ncbi:S9 family peptidase [uncultured Clostridium sp.]|jgi:predicted alpha/beta-fold hydrolase|uniref:alpha/beta hydrolase family protein n=1 Tax=uncultured Clostridium sp. TaxID=59620 RepID=UPI00272D86CC|nr:alpha/beta fold hydrolase [uncultured Clostridium sp.]
MNQELVRIMSVDEIEQPGILYTPTDSTNKIVIHVHGLNGNFYENRFLDILAKTYTEKGYAFLTFNNRGRDFITELLKGNNFTIIGGSLERFKDCILDIEGIVNWVKEKGYNEIVLEGHSYGCNKVLYYYNQKKDNSIKKIVLLAPCDIPSEGKKFLSEKEYKIAKEESTRLVNEGKENELIDFSVMANGKIAAGTYYYDFLPGGENDFIRYVEGVNSKSEILNSISIPVLVLFGDIDECVLTQSIEVVKQYLKNNINECNIQVIEGADHSYTGKYQELGNKIKENF